MVAASFATLAGAYLLGSIPTGYLVGRSRGVDLRASGSGNIGATNALRVLGKPAGIFVLLVDALKGWIGCAIVPHMAVRWLAPGAASPPSVPLWLVVLGGLAAIVGHNFTCWLQFRGGKGVATSAGVLLGIVPFPFFAVLTVFLVALAFTRIVSLSSLIAAALLPPVTWFWHREWMLLGFSMAITCLIVHRHRGNLQRLVAGTEPRLGEKRPPPATNPQS